MIRIHLAAQKWASPTFLAAVSLGLGCGADSSTPASSGAEQTYAPVSVAGFISATSASSSESGRLPQSATDSNDTSAWCAATGNANVTLKIKTSPSAQPVDQTFGAWWQVDFVDTQTVGSLHMRSGLFGDPEGPTSKIYDFVWAFQPDGYTLTDPWVLMPETDMHANRYQLILRLNQPIPNVKRVRLLVRPQPTDEPGGWDDFKAPPCLREVAFYRGTTDNIPTKPWFLTVDTFEDDYVYWTYQWLGVDHKTLVRNAVQEITGSDYPDIHDDIWYGEFHKERVMGYAHGDRQPGTVYVREPDGSLSTKCAASANCGKNQPRLSAVTRLSDLPEWITHEPAPAGILLTGNDLDYKERSYELASGFFTFLKNERRFPILGACGGMQMTAQAILSTDVKKEVYPNDDSTSQVVTTCGNWMNPSFQCYSGNCTCDVHFSQCKCGDQTYDFSALEQGRKCYFVGRTKATCCPCKESQVERKFSSNSTTNGSSLSNPYKSARQDLILNFLDNGAAYPNGFTGMLYHWDMVNANAALAGSFELFASYHTSEATVVSDTDSTLTQGIKLKNYPIYGTQFHWDHVDATGNESQRLGANFITLAMSRAFDSTNPMTIGAGAVALSSLSDLDKYTDWCSANPAPTLAISFAKPVALNNVIIVGGNRDNMPQTRPSSCVFSASADGRNWTSLTSTDVASFGEIQGNDGSTKLFKLVNSGSSKYYKVEIPAGTCLREILPLRL